jgi:hypothetical protein
VCNELLINPIIRIRTHHFSGMYHHTRHNIYAPTNSLVNGSSEPSGPSARRTKDLLKLNRDQLRWTVGLFTGHCHLNGHLFKLGLMDDPICERCLEEDESATHVLCDCEATAHLRFHHLGQFFMEPSDFYNAPRSKVLHFIRSVGLIKG